MSTQAQPDGDGRREAIRGDLEGPPQYLVDLRLVYNGHARSQAQQKLKRLWDEKPDQFLGRLAAAEKDYRGQVGRAAGSDPEAPPPPEDHGTDRALALIDRLLEEANE